MGFSLNNKRITLGHVSGEPEFWIFILGDLLVFALFFGLWSVNHLQQPVVFKMGQHLLNHPIGLINTLALLSSSFFVALALANARNMQYVRAKQYLMAAFFLGGLFIVLKIVEYTEKVREGYTLMYNDFFMYYFVFTGIHLVHVIVGMIALLLMMSRCSAPKPHLADIPFLEGAGVYWHMVDVLWIILFLLIYLI